MKVSVVIETFTLMHEYPAMAPADLPLVRVLTALRDQSGEPLDLEVIVVVEDVAGALASFLAARWPAVIVASLPGGGYFTMKNHGLRFAHGEIVALLDGDCVPCADWAEKLVRSIESGVDVAAGKTRYSPRSLLAHPLGLFDFGHIQNDRNGNANSFIANNVAFRTDVFREHPFDDRIPRSGAEYLLASRLKALGYKIVYQPEQVAVHEYDNKGLGFIGKRVRSGYDSINVCSLDEGRTVGESRLLKLGVFAPLGIFASRVWFDVKRFAANRRDLDISLLAVPAFWLMSLFMRGVEMGAGIVALVNRSFFRKRFGW